MAILGRLAVDQTWQGCGLGAALLRDAVERTQAAGAILGIRGLLVHALSDAAKAFYEHHGFVASPSRPMTLVMSLRGNDGLRGTCICLVLPGIRDHSRIAQNGETP